MTEHRVGTREEWRAARLELLAREKEHTRRGDELARERQALPWVAVEKEYAFDSQDGRKTLAELFDGHSQLMVYHLMFGPEFEAACPSCTAIADGFNGIHEHLAGRSDTKLIAVSRGPLEKLQAYKRRMGWTFTWVSSQGSDFNYDYFASLRPEQLREGGEYNFQTFGDMTPLLKLESGMAVESARSAGAPLEEFFRERPGMSTFALDDGVVYHCYSTYARGLDGLWSAYQWMDRAPFGRRGDDHVWIRRDEYATVNA
jgi:predicted dithiol-disulfide oxidoreductase (DUF899 family)